MKLKTLKDIEEIYSGENRLVRKYDLKAEAIKWVKQDLQTIRNNPLLDIEKKIADRFVRVWMERLNIIEDDLK